MFFCSFVDTITATQYHRHELLIAARNRSKRSALVLSTMLPHEPAIRNIDTKCCSDPDRSLQSTAPGKVPTDSILGASGEQGGGSTQSGKSSLVNTAELSEGDCNEQLDTPSGATDRPEVPGVTLSAANSNGEMLRNGGGDSPGDAVRTPTEANGEQGRPPGGTLPTAQDQPAAVGLALSSNPGADKYPVDLFDVLEAWVLEYLREKLHGGFLLSSHFQEYTRFLHVQQRPVTENDFILFRILGRGGFGAVNGTWDTHHPQPSRRSKNLCAHSSSSRIAEELELFS